MRQRLQNPERNADHISEDERRKAKPDRYGDSAFDKLPCRLVRVVIRRKVHSHAVDDKPIVVLLVDGLVKSELPLELAAVFLRHAAAGDAAGRGHLACAGIHAAHLHELKLHGASRKKARERKAYNRNSNESRNYKKKPSCEIRKLIHFSPPPSRHCGPCRPPKWPALPLPASARHHHA